MKKITLFVFLMLLSVSNIFSQEITEGKEYWFGLPECGKSSDEFAMWQNKPITLWITSKYDTKATIEYNNGSFVSQNIKINKNSNNEFYFSDELMNTESEKIRNKGIHISSDDPISVTVLIAYQWTGETFKLIPAEYLGKEYVTLNLYEDFMNMSSSGGYEHKPAQVLIVATEDSTLVSYIPTAKTEKGINKGEKANIFLNKGQTFLIKSKTYIINDVDLSGTSISSSKPIAVISGHTKGAFPQYNPIYDGGINPDYIRNVLVEMIPPKNLLGYDYISVPLKYLNRDVFDIVTDDRGDLIRFVATEDSTIIYQMNESGTSFEIIRNYLNKGEWFDILNQEQPAYYHSNKKVLVGQYGKSWINGALYYGKKEIPQYLTKYGQGMLMALTPVERWYNSASFFSPANMDNYIYLTFKSNDYNNILLDNKSISSFEVNQIPGTEYSYIISSIQAGYHNISSTNKNIRFAAYAYGNMDKEIDFNNVGFAYGYPVAMNYNKFCNDSIIVKDTVFNGNINGTALSINIDSDDCGGIESIDFYSNIENFIPFISPFSIGDKNIHFELNLVDTLKDAYAKLFVRTVSGSYLEKIYKYRYSYKEIPGIPKLVSPNNNKQNEHFQTNLMWNKSLYAHSYQIQLANTSNFSALVNEKTEIKDTLCPVILNYKTEYFWRVRAKNNVDYSSWSEVWKFKTIDTSVALISPLKGSTAKADSTLFLWSKISNTEKYIFQIANDETFNNNLKEFETTDNSFIIDEFFYETVYYWRVKAINSMDSGEWSEIWYFKTEDNIFEIPEIISPALDSTNIKIDVDFEWVNLKCVEFFRLQISKYNDFRINLVDTILTQNTFSKTLDLITKYYFRVCVTNKVHNGDWAYSHFTTSMISYYDSDNKINNNFFIYPNPADNELYIEFSNDFSNNCEIEIIDMQGVSVSSTKKSNLIYGTNKEQISLKDLPVGSYYCVLKIGGNRYSKMFVKM